MISACARRWLTAVLVLFLVAPVAAEEQDSESSLTKEMLEVRIAEAQESTRVDDDTRADLLRMYRQAIANLEQARANLQAADEFRDIADRAPSEIESIRESMARRAATDPMDSLRLSKDPLPDQIERILQEEQANRAAVETKHAALLARLESEALRPDQARNRIGDLRSQVVTLTDQMGSRSEPGGDPRQAEAEQWVAESQLEALQAEIAMLDQELITHTVRGDRLRAERDEVALSVSRITARIRELRAASNERQRQEASLAEEQARSILERGSAVEPAVRQLAEDNLVLVRRMQDQVRELDELAVREAEARLQVERVMKAFRGTRKRLQLEGSHAPIGLVVREERLHLPGEDDSARERRELQSTITNVSLRRIEAEDEQRYLDDVDTYIDGRIEEAGGGPAGPEARADLDALVGIRHGLLSQVVTSDATLERRMHLLDDTLRELEMRTAAFDEFLSERMLWVRSRPALGVDDLAALPGELSAVLSPAAWAGALRSGVRSWTRSPVLWLATLAAVALVVWRRRIREALVDCGRTVGRIPGDGMGVTFAAIGYTVLLVLPAPMLMLIAGDALRSASDATEFSRGIAAGMMQSGSTLLLLLAIRETCKPRGVAERHFKANTAILANAHRRLGWFIALVLPAQFTMWTVATIDSATGGGALAQLAVLYIVLALAWLALGIALPREGSSRKSWPVWLVVLGFTGGVVALVVLGFTHTAMELIRRTFDSAVLLTVAWFLRGLVRRWLLMTRRRLAYDAAIAEREARRNADADGEADHAADDIGAPEVDLVALDSGSQKLLGAAIVTTIIIGLAAIWGEMLPAFGIFEGVHLWRTVRLVDGVETHVPVTLVDLVVAILIGVGGTILARNLPSLINIILLKYGKVSSGVRYAVEALTTYSLVALTAMLVLGSLGVNGSQMGWAAAALGVGIGFGVQEIVANFICGLILLFERPVRVGDIITIGDASGTVTRIQIRATTLRDWDRKELLVPNKELITGRLLNWSLTDPVTRVVVKVGVAYGSDVQRALALLLEVAAENECVLADPEPSVIFEAFGESTLDLELRVFVRSLSDRIPTITALNSAIDRKYKEAGIEIAFPQRDVHLYSQGDDSG